jgi:hypothetical protein
MLSTVQPRPAAESSIFGRTRGAPGGFFNQVINGGHFITQEEFSNNLFASSGGTAGCLQSE